ncbi:MAG: hypothetical protein K2N27_07075 [Ruminococcus sp.]|nr:hypothetical protein [Ruminococcus sp.]
MKKIISVLLATSLLVTVFAGCSEGNNSVSGNTSQVQEKPKRISTSPIDQQIIGKWWNGSNGYIFDENRKVSIVMDFSSMEINFTNDGKFLKAGEIIEKDNIQYDGKNLIVQYINPETNDISILVNMERKDTENPDSFNGVYNLYGGLLIQFFSEMLGITFDEVLDDEDITLDAEIRGENFIVTLNNYCDYETKNGSLEMFSQYMEYLDENATSVNYNYTVDGDTLTMKYMADSSAPAEVYQRFEE